MKSALLFLASSVPSALALVRHTWSFENAPAEGFDDITFPMNIAEAPHKVGYYFAEQFNFYKIRKPAYIGLQPQADVNGKPMIRAVFSTFQDGSKTANKNCKLGADDGPGVSCAVTVPASYKDTYHLKVQHVSGTTWKGLLINNSTGGNEVQIGQWTLPNAAGKVRKFQAGFVEYFPWNSPKRHLCSDLPKTKVTFGFPFTSSLKELGFIDKPTEDGDCRGKVAASITAAENGWTVKVGWQ
ncbi:hypothetical protein CDD80_2869 [Ophiocordyceps camponoti-rufipedis]|uniref:Ubiquitin 3 binding protein But2 C-terminal domain-containing protein n=1 Tax=Ophiocordyceps camponoti-rufipedis TaxID=2004952 RepID=A0A2C5Z432_9HYPO|nr:hypothetical protein CDD80_2869 [Ophiocordyceps camponoti-rufipedis]